ncbi:unnamed protein product [Polarella glacialis]|uniref:Uncharacterized protein n=2 Tax=Polarella glacialis TaxID=89957 RepID=A0A813KAT5_POLGL|nr:unnamed protein product [Polarella glacialis]
MTKRTKENWLMDSCDACRKTMPCETHPNASSTLRFIAALKVADAHSSHSVTLYHDQAVACVPSIKEALTYSGKNLTDLTVLEKNNILNDLKTQLWSMKGTFRENYYTDTDELELRLLTQSFHNGSVLEAVPTMSLPSVPSGHGCPLAKANETEYDEDLGLMRFGEITASSMRLVVRVSTTELPDDEAMVNDTNSTGTRVKSNVT